MQRQKSFTSTKGRHLETLPGTDWQSWRWVALRSTGFPVSGALKLAAAPQVISAADAVIQATQRMESCSEKARQEIMSALDQLKATGQWNNKPKRRGLLKALSRVCGGNLLSGCTEALVAPSLALEEARSIYKSTFQESQEYSYELIREIARSADFREAIMWQNPNAVEEVLNPLLAKPRNGPSGGGAQRQRVELVASYWQRYCTKNDTIGFFGPVGWAQLVPDVEHISVFPGPQLIAYRKVYWEQWAIHALGTVIARMEGIRPWIKPFLVPYVRLEGMVLHHPQQGTIQMSEQDAVLLQECTGCDTAKQIAARLLKSPSQRFATEDDIYAGLRALADKEFVFWQFNIPQCPYPEQVLREALKRIEDDGLRQSALSLLDRFDATKARVEASAGDAEQLEPAYKALEQTFTEVTGLEPRRHKGRMYAGRTLIYQDSCRDIQVLLGAELLSSLSRPVSLLMTAARWFTSRVADIYKEKLLEIYSEFTRTTGNSAVEAVPFLAKVTPFLFDHGPASIGLLQDELRDKWERVLQLGSGAEPVHYSSEELQERVMQEFSATSPGWTFACYHSPDIMIAAASQEAIQRGEYFFVIGELHASVNSLGAALWLNQHPFPQDLTDAVESDWGSVGMIPYWTNARHLGSRTMLSLIPESYYQLECASDSFVPDRSKALPLSAMILQHRDGELWIQTRDNKLRMRVIDLLGRLISAGVADSFRVIGQRRHTPRVWIDRMVIKRETWRFSSSELQFTQCSDPGERFLQARIWARQQGIPRFAFLSVPIEKKPLYVDFDSPVLVDILSKMVRRNMKELSPNAIVSISEMLPTADQAWLADAENRRYTSEFRFVIVDPARSRQMLQQTEVAEAIAV